MSYEGHGTSNSQGVSESLLKRLTKGRTSMNINGGGENKSSSEEKGTESIAFVKSQTLVRVSELKDNAVSEVDKTGAGSGLEVKEQQQQPQGTVVRWERFLHVESIRVLLVENDDSTRHVVTALLRNCNYEVLAAANGLQAWKILEDLDTRIDIVLTEVVMPYIPGIPLLNKIMGHKTRKNIPVIMMSSHDSMGLVFKCLSKGAVDFLVKPIRKNELKILWQHVWRRCQSSSGSGSESGTQTQKSVKSKSFEKSDNSGSGGGENDMTNGLNFGGGSDDGSGAQSSWTKQAVETVSSQSMSPKDQPTECPDSTCAQVIRSNAENSDCNRVHISVARGGHEQKRVDTIAEGKNLETIIHINVKPEAENPVETPLAVIGSKLTLSEFNCSTIIKNIAMGPNNPTAESLLNKHKGGNYETSNPLSNCRGSDSTREMANTLDKNNNASIFSNEPNIELSLKRLRGVQDAWRSLQDDRYVLRRSEQSAFSRYNTCSKFSKTPGIIGSHSISDNSVKVAKQEPVHLHAHSADHLVYPSSNGVGNNLDMGSTSNKLSTHQSTMKDKSEATSTINGLHYSAFRPVNNDPRYSQQQLHFHLQSEVQSTEAVSARGSQKELQIQQPHHHRHQLYDLEQQQSSNHDDLSLKRLAEDAPHFGSANASGGPLDGKNRDCSLSRSISGSNHGSNGQLGSSTAINAAETNAESGVGQAGQSGSGDASGSGSGNRVDEDKVARRIAALSKFRQKKKDRCFTKKVRYENRKKLAEQRPRVRGQFVKQTTTDSSKRTSDE